MQPDFRSADLQAAGLVHVQPKPIDPVGITVQQLEGDQLVAIRRFPDRACLYLVPFPVVAVRFREEDGVRLALQRRQEAGEPLRAGPQLDRCVLDRCDVLVAKAADWIDVETDLGMGSLECREDIGIELRFALRAAGAQDMMTVGSRDPQLPKIVVAGRCDRGVVELLERRQRREILQREDPKPARGIVTPRDQEKGRRSDGGGNAPFGMRRLVRCRPRSLRPKPQTL